ncbi:MAG: DoxX family protein [Corynebacterium sp.]|nr:DoxX family protein [Corynebacterium sp.]
MIRKIARPMLASVFVWDGVDTLRDPSASVKETENTLKHVRSLVPRQYSSYVPQDPELVARSIAGAKVGAGSLLALGKAPRTSAAVLAATTLPSLVGAKPFWKAKDAEEKATRRSNFMTNTALLGALFITTQDLEGKPSVLWRAQKAGARTNKKIQQALPTKSETQKFADKASNWLGDASDRVTAYVDDHKDDWQDAGMGLLATAKSYVDEAKNYVDDNKDDWQKTGKALLDTTRDNAKAYSQQARAYVDANASDWLAAAEENAQVARKAVVKNAAKAQKRADKALKTADKKSGRAARSWAKKADKLQNRADKALHKAQKKVSKSFKDLV